MTIAVQSGLPTKRCTIALPLTMHRTVARCGTSWPEPVPHAHDTRSSVMAVTCQLLHLRRLRASPLALLSADLISRVSMRGA